MAQGHLRMRARLTRAARSERSQVRYRTPPEPKAPEGFFVSALSRAAFKFRPGMAGTEDPDSGIADACLRQASEARGLPEGASASRIPMAERAGRIRYGGAPFRASDGFVFQFGLPHLAAQRTLVVKISDTSHTTEPISPVPQRAFFDCRTQQCASAWRW